MRRKHFGVEIIICQVSLALVSLALLFCTLFLVMNIYVIYTGNRGSSAATGSLHLNTTIKNIELCKPSPYFCANLR